MPRARECLKRDNDIVAALRAWEPDQIPVRLASRYVSALLPLAMLAPDILDAIAAGRQPPD